MLYSTWRKNMVSPSTIRNLTKCIHQSQATTPKFCDAIETTRTLTVYGVLIPPDHFDRPGQFASSNPVWTRQSKFENAPTPVR